MKNNHIYIFNGPSRSGKSELASLINETDSIVIMDDFLIQNGLKELNDRISFKRIIRGPMIHTIIIITNTDDVHISRLIKELANSIEYEDYVVSYLEFKRGY